jgi:hypothetical protein
MTGKRGRPRNSEDELWQRAQTAQLTVNEELAAMQGCGLIPLPGKAKNRAALRLGVSMKTLMRLLALAPAPDPREEWIREWKQAELDDWQQDSARD